MSNFMSEAYDCLAQYENELAPLVDELQAKCEELNIPCLISICVANKVEPGGHSESIAICAHLNGIERTPSAMAVAHIALSEGIDEAIHAVEQYGLGNEYVRTSTACIPAGESAVGNTTKH